jgi:hypothetical protein
MRCPDCRENIVSGTAYGRLCFRGHRQDWLLRGLRFRGQNFDHLYDSPPIAVRFPARFCDRCPRLVVPDIVTAIPTEECPDCGGVIERGIAHGSLHFRAEGERPGLLCRLWRDFRRDTEIRADASFCPRCVRLHIRPETIHEVYLDEGWQDRI